MADGFSSAERLPEPSPGVRWICAGATDVGRMREVNEDAFQMAPGQNVWVLADGMGGHASGQIASQIAVEKAVDFMVRWRWEPDFVWPFEIMESRSFDENSVINAVRVANVRIYNRAQIDDECTSMGTTLVVLHHSAEVGLVVGHVGDSRCYRLRGDELTQLTDDHSLVNHLMKTFHLSKKQAQAKAGSNVIVRAVGLEDDVEPDLNIDQPQPGDLYLACSDGLTDLVEDWILQQILEGHRDALEEGTEALIRAANSAGGSDNITVLLLKALPP